MAHFVSNDCCDGAQGRGSSAPGGSKVFSLLPDWLKTQICTMIERHKKLIMVVVFYQCLVRQTKAHLLCCVHRRFIINSLGNSWFQVFPDYWFSLVTVTQEKEESSSKTLYREILNEK